MFCNNKIRNNRKMVGENWRVNISALIGGMQTINRYCKLTATTNSGRNFLDNLPVNYYLCASSLIHLSRKAEGYGPVKPWQPTM